MLPQHEMKEKLIFLLDSKDEMFIQQALVLNETFEEPLLQPEDIVPRIRIKSWSEGSFNWSLLEEYNGRGFQDIESLSISEFSKFPMLVCCLSRILDA